MRINKFLAQVTGMSRRAADSAIAENRVKINDMPAELGVTLQKDDIVTFQDVSYPYTLTTQRSTLVLLHKPVGYVCSRNGQGSKTIYDLLPPELHHLKPVGRLDKDSSGLLLLTDDGDLAYQYTHPKFEKEKVYEVAIDKDMRKEDQEHIENGVLLEDGISKLNLTPIEKWSWRVTMNEGRNRQIRRTFETIGYRVIKLHRVAFGPYELGDLASGKYKQFVV